jgi:hypothetical protein
MESGPRDISKWVFFIVFSCKLPPTVPVLDCCKCQTSSMPAVSAEECRHGWKYSEIRIWRESCREFEIEDGHE